MAGRPKRNMADYADLLDRPRPAARNPMSMHDRAAQFSPYAALVGYGDIVAETARLTDAQLLLDDGQKEQLDMKLQLLQEALACGETPAVEVSHFVPDSRKQGGAYRITVGRVKRIDPIAGRLILTDRKEIQIEHINELFSEVFAQADSETGPEIND